MVFNFCGFATVPFHWHTAGRVQTNMLSLVKGVGLKATYTGRSLWVGACNSTIFLLRRFHRFIFRSNLLRMRLPRECHNQSQDTNWRHCVTGPELPFFHKRKGVLKIDQSVKMPWHKLSMGIASSGSSAPVHTKMSMYHKWRSWLKFKVASNRWQKSRWCTLDQSDGSKIFACH